jgi:hypothetical protein
VINQKGEKITDNRSDLKERGEYGIENKKLKERKNMKNEKDHGTQRKISKGKEK